MPKIDVLDQIPVKLIKEMQHAIGWDKNRVTGTKNRVMHAYRNRFCTNGINEGWENLCFYELAERYEQIGNITFYCLTHAGLDYLGKLCGLKIVEVD